MKKTLFALAVFAIVGCVTTKHASVAAPETAKTTPRADGDRDSLILSLLHRYPQYFDSLLQQPGKWNIQVIYTQIDRKANNEPVFTDHVFGSSPAPYFYPASTVKMPVAFLALQRLHELNLPGLDLNSGFMTSTAAPGQTAVYNDPTTPDGRPTIAQYIRKIFLTSDNDAFNRLYEFLGQEYINNTLHRMGYDSAQVLHRLNVFLNEEGNRNTNPVAFYDTSAHLLYRQPGVRSSLVYQQRHTFFGQGYYSGGKLVNEPFDFSHKNRLPLADLHSILKSVLFPEAVPARRRFRLAADDYRFLYRYMSMRPGDSRFPPYDSSYNGAYSKLLLYGGKGDLDPGVRIFNKEGDAYGFLTDVAYIIDERNGVEFMVSASISCNSDGIYNDDHYDFETIGLPFLKHLGLVLYEYERSRPRKNVPDLSKFKLNDGP